MIVEAIRFRLLPVFMITLLATGCVNRLDLDKSRSMTLDTWCNNNPVGQYYLIARVESVTVKPMSCKNIYAGWCDSMGDCDFLTYIKSCKGTETVVKVVEMYSTSDGYIATNRFRIQTYLVRSVYNPLGWNDKAVISAWCDKKGVQAVFEPIFLASDGNEYISGMSLEGESPRVFNDLNNYKDIEGLLQVPPVKFSELPNPAYGAWALSSGVGKISEDGMYRIRKMVPFGIYKDKELSRRKHIVINSSE